MNWFQRPDGTSPRPRSSRSRAGRFASRRSLLAQTLEPRSMLAGDGVGLGGDLLVRYEFVDMSGTPVETLQVGRDYQLNTYVRDTRATPTGVLQTYLDVTFDTSLLSLTGPIEHSPLFNTSTEGSTSTAGLLDDVGGVDTDRIAPTAPGEDVLLFSIDVRAGAAGTLNLGTALPTFNPRRPLFFLDATLVSMSDVDVICDSIEIVGAGVNFSRTSGLRVAETATSTTPSQDTLTVVLSTAPTADVTFTLTSSMTTEVTVSPATVSFTPANWNTPQTIRVNGVNEFIDDDDRLVTIVTGNTLSGDSRFNGLDLPDITVTNVDDDNAGITVTPTAGLRINEANLSTATFSVRLDSQPTANVTVPVRTGDATEGTVSPTSLTFTPTNWNQFQNVTVTAVDDDIRDGDVPFLIITDPATSADPKYQGRNGNDVSVLNVDNELPQFLIAPTSGLVTSEAGTTATFTVRLGSQPSANVRLPLSVSAPAEVSINASELTFTTANWNVPQSVIVTGVNDFRVDGNIPYTIVTGSAISADPQYSGLNPIDVTGINNNTTVAGVTVSPTTGLITTESAGTASFTLVLDSRPTAPVSIDLSSSDTTEGTVGPGRITFSIDNWNVPQSVTVTGVPDDSVDGPITYSILTSATISTDPSYSGRAVADVVVTNRDDSIPGISVNRTSGLVTNEAGGSDTFEIRLATRPTQPVSIDLTSSDLTEGTVSPARVTITPASWPAPAIVTVTGVNDSIADGSIPFTIVTSRTISGDVSYSNLDVPDVTVTNNNDGDAPAIRVTAAANLTTAESGTTATFTVVLESQPTADVVIPLQSSAPEEVAVQTPSLRFTPTNWNTPQTVTLRGVDDLVDDGQVAVTIRTLAAVSDDSAYNGRDAIDVMVTNTDDDVASVLVDPTSDLVVTEAGISATYTVRLTSQPTSPVTIAIATNDASEGVANLSQVTFNATNWSDAQTITVTGVDDLVDDGDIGFMIVNAAAVSDDPMYDGLDVMDVSVTNIDDDEPGIAVIPTSGLMVGETGTTATFEIVLTSQPTADVTIPLQSSDESSATVLPASITFTPLNWNDRQTVTVTGVNDAIVDGDQAFVIRILPAVSDDPVFAGRDATDVSGVTTDDDSAALSINSPRVNEGNSGTTTLQFEVTLSAAVAGGFTIDAATLDGTAVSGSDYQSTSQILTFAGTAGEVQTVSVAIIGDLIVETSETFTLGLSNLTGANAGLAERITLPATPARATIVNDDSTMIMIAATDSTTGSAPEGDGDARTPRTFTITSTAAVQGGFLISVNTNDGTATVAGGDYIDNDSNVRFVGTAGETQTFVVNVIGDDVVEPDESFTVTLGNVTGTVGMSSSFFAINRTPITATIQNDDFPRLVIRDVTVDNREGTGAAGRFFDFEVELIGDVLDADGFRVGFEVADGTATAADNDWSADVDALEFSGVSGQVQTIRVLVASDDRVEPDETFQVRLTDILDLDDSQVVEIDPTRLTATIVDDDVASVTLSADVNSVREGGSVIVTATLSAAVPGGLTIDVTSVAGTASANDFSAVTSTLTFAGMAGETQTLTLNTTADNLVERDETLSLMLQNLVTELSDRITLGDDFALTIDNDDSAIITLMGPSPTTEGDDSPAGVMNFQVTLSAPVDGGLSIPWTTVNGTAVAGTDFVAGSGALTFNGTTLTQTIPVSLIGDLIVESDETFSLRIGPVGDLLPGLESSVSVTADTATATILNDDTASITLSGPVTTTEPGGPGQTRTLTYTATLGGGVAGGVSVDFATANGTTTAADVTPAAGTLTFTGTPGETRTFDVIVNGDGQVESTETFSVSLSNVVVNTPSGGQVSLAGGAVTTTITDDDSVTIGFANPSLAVAETTGNVAVTIRMTTTGGARLNEPLVGRLIVRGASTAGASDFVLSTNTFTFPVGSGDAATQTVSVQLIDDGIQEPVETLILGLEIVSGGGTVGGITTSPVDQVITITDDPRDGVLRGVAHVNGNGISGVTMRLAGTSNQGETITRVTVTDSMGRYEFNQLPGGTYSITQDQPVDYHDGLTTMGFVTGGISSGIASANRIESIVLPASGVGQEFNFGEHGLTASAIDRRLFTSRGTSLSALNGSSTNGSSTNGSIPPTSTPGLNALDDAFARWF